MTTPCEAICACEWIGLDDSVSATAPPTFAVQVPGRCPNCGASFELREGVLVRTPLGQLDDRELLHLGALCSYGGFFNPTQPKALAAVVSLASKGLVAPGEGRHAGCFAATELGRKVALDHGLIDRL